MWVERNGRIIGIPETPAENAVFIVHPDGEVEVQVLTPIKPIAFLQCAPIRSDRID